MEPTALKAIVVSLLGWISAHTNYPMPAETPMIAVVPHDYLERVACKQACDVLGIYADSGVIYLDNSLVVETNICAQSVLLHELVHYNQEQHKRFVNLHPIVRWKMREQEAHDIQKLYLSEHGRSVDFGSAFRLGAFSGESCGYPQYAGG